MQMDGTYAFWHNCSPIVSAGSMRFANKIYVEEKDRSAGIEVYFGSGTVPTLPEGADLNFEAVISTINGERVLIQPIITGYTSGSPPEPLFMPNWAVGGAPGQYDPGVTLGTGLINEGLLVKIAGKVLSQGSDYFLMDDGSGTNPPLKVSVAGLASGNSIPIPSTSCHVAVTGMSSKEPYLAGYRAVLRPRSSADVEVLSTQ